MQPHGIGIWPHLLTQHHVEIAEHSPRDARLVHVYGAHAVVAPLRRQPHHLFTVFMHAKRDPLGGIVGADHRLAPLITKLERAELVGLTCGEYSAPFLTVVTHLRDAKGAHRHPEVGQQTAEPIEGELAQRRRLQEREQQAGHQPEAHHIGEDANPATGNRSLFQIGKANEPAAKQAKQRRQQSV